LKAIKRVRPTTGRPGDLALQRPGEGRRYGVADEDRIRHRSPVGAVSAGRHRAVDMRCAGDCVKYRSNIAQFGHARRIEYLAVRQVRHAEREGPAVDTDPPWNGSAEVVDRRSGGSRQPSPPGISPKERCPCRARAEGVGCNQVRADGARCDGAAGHEHDVHVRSEVSGRAAIGRHRKRAHRALPRAVALPRREQCAARRRRYQDDVGTWVERAAIRAATRPRRAHRNRAAGASNAGGQEVEPEPRRGRTTATEIQRQESN